MVDTATKSTNIKCDLAFLSLKNCMRSYAPISDDTWRKIVSICRYVEIKKDQLLYPSGVIPKSFSFVHQGLFRAYVSDQKGKEYNKIFFAEGMFPGTMTSLLKSTPSNLAIQALEHSYVIEIDFKKYRELMRDSDEIKLYQIHYLEKNWLVAKDAREIEIVQLDATQRYLRFIAEHQEIAERISQYHIASHLGVTPTQLSRIRKSL